MFVKQALKTEKVKTRRLGYWPVLFYRMERHNWFKRFMQTITWGFMFLSFWEVPSHARAMKIHQAGGEWKPMTEIIAVEVFILSM